MVTRQAMEIKLKGDAENGIRTFILEQNDKFTITTIDDKLVVKESDMVKLIVPVSKVISVIPVMVGNSVSARDYAAGKPLSSGEVIVLGVMGEIK